MSNVVHLRACARCHKPWADASLAGACCHCFECGFSLLGGGVCEMCKALVACAMARAKYDRLAEERLIDVAAGLGNYYNKRTRKAT